MIKFTALDIRSYNILGNGTVYGKTKSIMAWMIKMV